MDPVHKWIQCPNRSAGTLTRGLTITLFPIQPFYTCSCSQMDSSKTETQDLPITITMDSLDGVIQTTSGTPYRKAGIAKRTGAAVIDGVIAALLNSVPFVGSLAAGAYILLRDGLDFNFMRGRSIGKTLMRIRPVDLNGGDMGISKSVRRNLPFAVGSAITFVPMLGWIFGPLIALAVVAIEIALVFSDSDGRRMGDKFAGTQVIDA